MNKRSLKLLCLIISFYEIICENALTEDELQQLSDNDFTVSIDNTADKITLEHDGYPNHSFDGGCDDNPNTAQEVNHVYALSLEATDADMKGCGGLGPIGLAVSGAAFYNPYIVFVGMPWKANAPKI